MSRSTTIKVVNATNRPLELVDAHLTAGRWGASPPPARVPQGGSAIVLNTATGRFGSAQGLLRFRSLDAVVSIGWRNPFVGRNSYQLDVAGPRIGCACDGDDDDSDTNVTFTVMPARKITVPGFLPSTRGFHFTNSWPDEPLKRINLRFGSVPIGSASNGLCGGMSFAARDWFEARRAMPATDSAPADGTPMRRFIVERLIDSFDLPMGVVPYATIMATRYPDDDRDALAMVGQVPSRATLLARRTLPRVMHTIDSGHPCPLGLVMVSSDDAADLRRHHQVLAYAYQLRGTNACLWVYDPNSPDDDTVTIAFDTATTDHPPDVHHTVDSSGPLVCAFVPRYTAKTPPEETT